MPTEMTMFSEIGEERMRAIVADFVDRVYADTMIGFFFRDFDPAQLRRHEYQFMARALGADVRYEGRPIRQAHARHPIMGGQFNRRKTILEATLRDHHVPQRVVFFLLEHTEKLRPLVTAQPGSTCITDSMTGPLVHSYRPTSQPSHPPVTATETGHVEGRDDAMGDKSASNRK